MEAELAPSRRTRTGSQRLTRIGGRMSRAHRSKRAGVQPAIASADGDVDFATPEKSTARQAAKEAFELAGMPL